MSTESKNDKHDIEQYIAKKELSKYFRIDTRTIDKWADQGLARYQIGKKIYFRLDEVSDFIQEKLRKAKLV